jgi:F-type H+-transporting ATPase subunit delta
MPMLDSQSDALARIYAGALFDLAQEAGGQEEIESVGAQLQDVIELASADAKFSEFLTSQILGVKERGASLQRIFKGRVSDVFLNFLLVLNEKGRLGRLSTIATAYDETLQERFGRVEVDVFTASAISDAQAESISSRLHAILDREPVLHRYVDEAMLGGLRLRIGDQLVDASVATQLRRIGEQLASSGAAEIRNRVGRIITEAGD